MAKIGYIQLTDCDSFETEREWMNKYGCCRIVEEIPQQEKTRPQWKSLADELDRGDEIVMTAMSNAIRGPRELAMFFEYCRIKAVRFIFINDGIDSAGKLFPDTKLQDVLFKIGSLSADVAVMRRQAAHISRLTSTTKAPGGKILSKQERENAIVNMYQTGSSIDAIWRASGFRSRSSVFRILNKHGITLDRGPHSGPVKKRKEKADK